MAKLGLHFIQTTPWIRRVAMPGPHVKIINPPEDIQAIFPSKRVIGRIYMTDGEEGQYYSKGAKGGRAYFERCLPFYRRAPGVWAYEAFNEPAMIKTPGERAALDDATCEWLHLMHACGLKGVVGNFSERNPPDGTIHEFRRMIEMADYLGGHYYGAPYLTTDPMRHVLRYRQLAAEMLAAGMVLPRMLIGETGIDLGIVGQGRKGWQKVSGLDWAGYFADLRWYEAELAKDSYIVGAFLFSAGSTGDWRTFDINEKQAAELAAWQRAQTPPTPQPIPPTVSLPEHEQGNAKRLAEKAAWWQEETVRAIEQNDVARARKLAISQSKLLARLRDGL